MAFLRRRTLVFSGAFCVILFFAVGNYYFDLNLLNGTVFGGLVQKTHDEVLTKNNRSQQMTSPKMKLKTEPVPATGSPQMFTSFQNGQRATSAITKDNSQQMTTLKDDKPHEITVVTLYVNIGKFQKGTGNYFYTPNSYRKWMGTWKWLTNRVIAFFDQDETLEHFRKIRSAQPADKSVLMKINRTDFPAFKRLDKIKEIFASPNYPKHPPNTVVPEYSCAMNAKYDALQKAMLTGLVHTKYVAWVDIGLFRHLADPNKRPAGDLFTLEVPDSFNSSCIGMSEVTPKAQVSNVSPRDYIYSNKVWVGGAFSMGTIENMWTFSESYKWTSNQLIDQNMSSTDQQVIGAMFSPSYSHLQKVGIQAHRYPEGTFGLLGSDLAYFSFGYACKEAGEKRRKFN